MISAVIRRILGSPLARRSGVSSLVSRLLWRLRSDWDYTNEYTAVFRDDRFWQIVGSPTERDFHNTGRTMFEGLLRHGLTPDSAVLDVGCGTGRLTAHLVGHLSERGRYVGLDIADDAVRFCRAHYARPNFTFARNEGTKLPVAGPFDLAVFFSVFTHLYPNETEAMLRETVPLLAPGGRIIATFWFSSDPGAYSTGLTTWTGNRSRIEFAREHLDLLLARAGLVSREEDWQLTQKVLVITPAAAARPLAT